MSDLEANLVKGCIPTQLEPGIDTRNGAQSPNNDTLLSSLPISAHNAITSSLTALDVAKLIACGDRRLTSKLVNGGVTHLDLEWRSPSWIPWPRNLLSIFEKPLTHFSVTSAFSDYPLCPSMSVASLPTNLLSLVLCFDNIFALLESSHPTLANQLPSLEHLELVGKRLKMNTLRNLPPSLRALRISDPSAFLPSSDFFASFPDTLTSLELDFNFIDRKESDMYPKNLEILRLQTVQSFPGWLKKLPTTLRDLSFTWECYDGDTYPLDFTLIPPNLTSLEVGEEQNVFLGDLEHLPATLTNLSLFLQYGVDDSNVSRLPRALKRFECSNGGLYAPKGLPNLPEGLVALNVVVWISSFAELKLFPKGSTIALLRGRPLQFDHSDSLLEFPSTLTELQLPWISDKIAQCLPNGLISLKLREQGTLSEIGAAALPKTLKRLLVAPQLLTQNSALSPLAHLSSMIWDIDHAAPLSITPSCLSGLSEAPNWASFEIRCSSSANTSAMQLLSSEEFGFSLARLGNLRKFILKLYRAPKFELQSFRFPDSLRHLHLHGLSTIPTHQHLTDALPRNLGTLDICSAQSEGKWGRLEFEALPRSLTTLRADNIALPPITEDDEEEVMSLLPPYLSTYPICWLGRTTLILDPLTRLYGLEDMFNHYVQ